MTELMGLRHTLKKSSGVKITSNTFLIRALAVAARDYPLTVGRLDGERIRIAETVTVGFAVDCPQGLVVPRIEEAHTKTLAEIAVQEKILTHKARHNQLALDEITGEMIGLSNLGAYGVDSFLGIVPPSATVLLTVGNVLHGLAPIEKDPPDRRVASLSLAVDQRIVGCEYAARFLRTIVDHLEEPATLM